MNIKWYLERINYVGPIDLSYKVLSELQYMHLMTVPFENLDIHNNIRIDLTSLFDKIVTRKRGGFCYELNGLFYQLLKEIGFTVKMVSARVYDGYKEYSQEFDHLALIVTINDDHYLTDVGFGEFSLYPVNMMLNKNNNDPTAIFRIETFNENYQVVKKKKPDGEFVPEYIFSETQREVEEFYPMCNYHQTNSESHFMQKRICSLPTKNGRITLTGNTLKITENEKVKVQQLKSEKEVQETLWNYFRIKL